MRDKRHRTQQCWSAKRTVASQQLSSQLRLWGCVEMDATVPTAVGVRGVEIDQTPTWVSLTILVGTSLLLGQRFVASRR